FLQRIWRGNGGRVGDLVNGIAVVRRLPSGAYQYLLHSSWPPGAPQYTAAWAAPEYIADSLMRGVGGVTPVYDDNALSVLTAAAPVYRRNGTVAGFVVTTMKADSFLGDLRWQLLRFLPFPAIAF